MGIVCRWDAGSPDSGAGVLVIRYHATSPPKPTHAKNSTNPATSQKDRRRLDCLLFEEVGGGHVKVSE